MDLLLKALSFPFFFLLLTSPAFSSTLAGSIVAAGNDLVVTPLRPLKKDPRLKFIPLYWDDVIETGSLGQAKLNISPNLSLTLDPNTKIKIIGSTISSRSNELLTDSAIEVLSGTLQGRLVKRPGSKQNSTIIMPRAVSSIRGTTFIATAKIDGESSLEVLEGRVQVRDQADDSSYEIDGGNAIIASAQSSRATLSKSKSTTLSLPSDDEIRAEGSSTYGIIAAEQKPEIDALEKDLRSRINETIARLKHQMKTYEQKNRQNNQKIRNNIRKMFR